MPDFDLRKAVALWESDVKEKRKPKLDPDKLEKAFEKVRNQVILDEKLKEYLSITGIGGK